MKRTMAVFTLVLACAALALAHGNERHVMGTVTSVGPNSITLETTAKKTITVKINDKTKFEKSGSAATLKDLKVGDRVVIHADQNGNKLTATEVQFGPTKGKSSMPGMHGMAHTH